MKWPKRFLEFTCLYIQFLFFNLMLVVLMPELAWVFLYLIISVSIFCAIKIVKGDEVDEI